MLFSALATNCTLWAEEFSDNYDLNGDYARYVYRVDGMRIWNQSENGHRVREWGPSETGKLGTLVLRYQFERPIKSCSLQAFVQIWRKDDFLTVAVSHDDKSYTIVSSGSMIVEAGNPPRAHRLDLTSLVAGHQAVYIRFQARGTRLNSHITTPSVLRTVEAFTTNTTPFVFDFRVKLED